MTTIQDRRREAETIIDRLTAQREHYIASMIRCEGRLTSARRKLERLKRACAKALEKDATDRLLAVRKIVDVTDIPVTEFPISDDLAIPTFLDRAAAGKAKDAAAAAEIKAANEATKKTKARGRIETMKAKQAGDTRKMPLTGRSALEAIRQG